MAVRSLSWAARARRRVRESSRAAGGKSGCFWGTPARAAELLWLHPLAGLGKAAGTAGAGAEPGAGVLIYSRWSSCSTTLRAVISQPSGKTGC